MRPRSLSTQKGMLLALPLLALFLGLAGTGCGSRFRTPGDIASDLTDEERFLSHFESAIFHWGDGRIETATSQAERGLEFDPEHQRLLLIAAVGRLSRGREGLEYIGDLAQAIEYHERNPARQRDWRVQRYWGETLEQIGRYYDIVAQSVRSGERPTDAVDPIARAAELDAEVLNYWREAKGHFKQAAALKSGQQGPLRGLVRINILLGQEDEAMAWAEKLLDALTSGRELNENELNLAGASIGREDRLLAAKRELIETEIETRVMMASHKRKLGNHDEALELIQNTIDLSPRRSFSYSLKARLLFEMSRYTEARDAVDRFLELKAIEGNIDFDSEPAVRQAYKLRDQCERALALR